MTGSTISRTNQARWFRKSLVIPAEHGSWSWLLVPYFVGLIVAGQFNLAGLLVLLGGLSGFLVRQPMTAWMQIRAGRGRRSDQKLAAAWSLGLGALAFLSLLALLAMGNETLLWLLVPSIGIFIVYLLAARQKRVNTRTAGMEVAGAAGLAVMAPAAYISMTGSLDNTAWALWFLMAGQNTVGVMYVRLRIADTHRRPIGRSLVVWFHSAVLLLVAVTAFIGWVPRLVLLPFVVYLGRAVWAAAGERPIASIKRFGFTEVGVEIVGGILIAVAWVI